MYRTIMESVDLNPNQLLIEGSFRRAVEVFKDQWSAYKMNIGPDMPQTVWSQVRYADVLRMAGDYEEALEIYRDVLVKMENRTEVFNEAALDVKLSLANIIYRRNVDEAAVVIAGVEEIVSRMPMDDTKIALKKKLAETMRDLGRYESALAYFEEIYKFKSNNDPRSLDTLSSHVDVATVYLEQGRYMKAMDILSSVHEEVKIINPNHPCTLKADRYIADVCVHYGITLIACQKYEHIALAQKTENPKSLDTLTTLHKLSLAYLKDGRSKEALETIEGVYNTRKVETPWHPDTKRVEIDFIMMQLRKGDVPKATCLLMSALESKYECFDLELVVDIPRNIAMFFRELNEPDKAREAIGIYENLFQKQCQMPRLGPMHPETLLTKTKIAETHLYLKNLDEALKSFEEVLNTKIDVLKNDTMDCLDVRKHIAEIYFSQGKFEKSFEHYCEVYRNERMYLGAYHEVTEGTENKVDGFCLLDERNKLLTAIKAGDLQSLTNFCNAGNINLDSQDDYGCTTLHAAVVAGHPKVVRFLLGKGASLYVKNKTGKIPRDLAKKNDVKCIFNIIMQLFMDVKIGNKKDVAEVLSFDDGAVINVLDEEGKTLLHWACQKGDKETVDLLLKKGADPRVKNKSGDSALDISAKLNHGDIVQTMNRYVEELNLLDQSKRSPSKEINYKLT